MQHYKTLLSPHHSSHQVRLTARARSFFCICKIRKCCVQAAAKRPLNAVQWYTCTYCQGLHMYIVDYGWIVGPECSRVLLFLYAAKHSANSHYIVHLCVWAQRFPPQSSIKTWFDDLDGQELKWPEQNLDLNPWDELECWLWDRSSHPISSPDFKFFT